MWLPRSVVVGVCVSISMGWWVCGYYVVWLLVCVCWVCGYYSSVVVDVCVSIVVCWWVCGYYSSVVVGVWLLQ